MNNSSTAVSYVVSVPANTLHLLTHVKFSDHVYFKKLQRSLDTYGQLRPVLVTPCNEDTKLYVVEGSKIVRILQDLNKSVEVVLTDPAPKKEIVLKKLLLSVDRFSLDYPSIARLLIEHVPNHDDLIDLLHYLPLTIEEFDYLRVKLESNDDRIEVFKKIGKTHEQGKLFL